MAERYRDFSASLPALCAIFQMDEDEMVFNDLTSVVEEWLRLNPW